MFNIAWQLKIALALAILTAGGLWFWSALSDAYDRGENACKAEYAQKQITVMEKRHEIANKRPDDGAFLDGLLKHDSSWQ